MIRSELSQPWDANKDGLRPRAFGFYFRDPAGATELARSKNTAGITATGKQFARHGFQRYNRINETFFRESSENMEEQSVATEFSVMSRLPFYQLLEPAERGPFLVQDRIRKRFQVSPS